MMKIAPRSEDQRMQRQANQTARPRNISHRLLRNGSLLLLLVLTSGMVRAADVSSPTSADQSGNELSRPPKQQIHELIQQLGDSRYAIRRSAATELRQIGAEAFDQLHAATSDSDPEVAASANYLLRQVSVQWTRNDDPPALRNLLRDYDRLSESNRKRRIGQLTALAKGEGIPGLCRIARYDRSPVVSRLAALEIIQPRDDGSQPQIDDQIVERELEESTRAAVVWLRRFLEQQRDPAESLEFWQKLVDEEFKRLEQNSGDTNQAIVTGLLWNLAELQRSLGHSDAIYPIADRMMSLNAEDPETTAVSLLRWMTRHKTWEALDAFLAKYQPQFEQSKRPLYYAALARAGQEKIELAESLAEKASQIDAENTLDSFINARTLEEENQFDWAVREYRSSIDDDKIASHEGVLARIYLSSLLYDHEHYEQAADVLEPLAKAVNNKGQVGEFYTELRRYYNERLNLPKPEGILAKFHFYRACQYHAAQDWKREQQHLQDSIKFDKTDADVVIAMYRAPQTDADWKENVRQRINDLSRQFQQLIDENPTDQDNYNQWAWLIANTEGDYQKAVRYSHRSLELNERGDSVAAGYLDTLGRCYYAAGDLENAVKYQRQAVEKIDYMQVMQRQLALFEKALAEKNGANSDKPQTNNSDSSS